MHLAHLAVSLTLSAEARFQHNLRFLDSVFRQTETILVDLVGIEPTTSSMPWNFKIR
jgi:hypothetical protein